MRQSSGVITIGNALLGIALALCLFVVVPVVCPSTMAPHAALGLVTASSGLEPLSVIWDQTQRDPEFPDTSNAHQVISGLLPASTLTLNAELRAARLHAHYANVRAMLQPPHVPPPQCSGAT